MTYPHESTTTGAALSPAASYQGLRWDAGPDGDRLPGRLTRDALTLYLHLCNFKGHRMLPATEHPVFNWYWRMECAACRRDVSVRIVPGRTGPIDTLGSAQRYRCAAKETPG